MGALEGRWVGWSLLLVLLLANPSACRRSPDELSAPAVPQASRRHAGATLTYFGDPHEFGRTLEHRLIDRFERDTGIHVRHVPRPYSTSETYLSYDRFFRGGRSDGDVFLLDVTWPSSFAPFLLDLGPALGRAVQAHLPVYVANDTVGGRLVAMPYFLDLGMLYYRSDLLRTHGYAHPPRTWTELEAMARTIQAAERPGHPDFWGFVWQGAPYEGLTCNALEWQESQGGGGLIDPRTGRVTVDNPRAIAAFRRAAGWVGTISPPAVTDYDEPQAASRFRAGGAVFMRNWIYVHAALAAAGSPVRGKFGMAPLPHGEGARSASVLGGWQLGVSRRSRQAPAAVEFVRYLTCPEVQAWRAREGGYMPTMRRLLDDPGVRAALPLVPAAPTLLANVVTRPAWLGERYNPLSTVYFQGVATVLEGEEALATARRMRQDMEQVLSWPESSVRTPAGR